MLCAYATSAYAAVDASIKSVTATDPQVINVTLAAPISGDTFTWDAKILKDISVKSATKSSTNAKVINLQLGAKLMPDTSYSILSIFWADGNIDFTLKSAIENTEYANTDASASIQKVVVKDAENIDIYFKDDLKDGDFEFKVLSNLGVETIKRDAVNATDLIFTVKTPLESNMGYILMMVSLKDSQWNDINFSEGIYDFNTGEIKKPLQDATATGSTSTTESLSTQSGATGTGEKIVNLNSAAVITQTDSGSQVDQKLTEEVASTVAETPKSGPETWGLILASLIINTVYFYSRRKKVNRA